MATFIKVERKGSELLRRNQEQTQANRLAKVEGDEQRRTELQARDERQKALAAQGLDAAASALPGGQRRVRFLRDEPAASFRPEKTLLISWNNASPILSDPQAELVYAQGFGSSIATTLTVGSEVPAVGVSGENSYRAWSYKTKYKISAKSDFTYEGWVQCGSPSGFFYALFIVELAFVNGYNLGLRFAAIRNSSNVLLPNGNSCLVLDPVEGYLYNISPPVLDIAQPLHLCIMRRNGAFYFYINGSIIRANSSLDALAIEYSDDPEVQFAVYATPAFNLNKMGQLRLSPTRSRYTPESFTPNLLPFRK